MAGVGSLPFQGGRNIIRFIICYLSMNTSLFLWGELELVAGEGVGRPRLHGRHHLVQQVWGSGVN